jgi:hypothetical protein
MFDFSQVKAAIPLPQRKFPVAAAARPDVYDLLINLKQFEFKNAPLGFPSSIPIFPDPAASSIALAQTEECMLFYDQKSLSLYLNRAEDPMAWIKYCCELAGIPYPTEDDPTKQFPPTM